MVSEIADCARDDVVHMVEMHPFHTYGTRRRCSQHRIQARALKKATTFCPYFGRRRLYSYLYFYQR